MCSAAKRVISELVDGRLGVAGANQLHGGRIVERHHPAKGRQSGWPEGPTLDWFCLLNVGGPNRVVGASTINSCSGGDLLSHTLPGAVPSALWVLASGFGMGPGVSPTL